MAVAQAVLSEEQRATLEALCDTFVPSVETDTHDELERGFMARSATDLACAPQIEGLMGDVMTPDEIAQFAGLLDALAGEGFLDADLDGRTALIHGIAEQDPEAKHGLKAFKGLTVLFFYGLPDENGSNPNWEAIGYPGPKAPPPSADAAPKTLTLHEVTGESATVSCDVVVVGSGAGGGVIAAECAKAGKDVVVLEMGGYSNESDFTGLEIPSYFDLYYGGGLATSESGSIALLAGQTLGGGTVVNYMNCVRTPDTILSEWAGHGIDGLDSPDFIEQHMDVVLERIGANTEATTQNGTHQRMIEACDAARLRASAYLAQRRARRRPGVLRLLLARLPQGLQALGDEDLAPGRLRRRRPGDRRLLRGEDPHRRRSASGVEATVTHADGSTTALTVEASTVVVACGAIESPALLLRSGIGGPAAGKNLRLHPACVVYGVYDERVEGWNGQIQSALSDHFFDVEDGFGFLIEAAGMLPAFSSTAYPWDSGEQHKQLMSMVGWTAPFITVARDHGSGEVVLDDLGRALVRWDFTDDVDAGLLVQANVELAKLHRAAGAAEIFTAHSREQRWRRGDDFDAFTGGLEGVSYAPNDITTFTAHQMGSCRMGSDPETSVADGRGELHDTKGVWIGDGSAFPTAPGVNPMVTIMSLAHRTAASILA